MTASDSMPIASNEDLAVRAQRGCVASFEELVRRFQVPLRNFLRNRGAGADADDLLQETFLRAYTNLHRYRRRHRAAAWLFTIARRLSINHYHRAAAFRAAAIGGEAALESLASLETAPDELAAAAEDRKNIWRLAAGILSEEEVTALWLYYVEELPAREVGVVLDRSWLATKSLLSRARKKLKPRLSQFHARPQCQRAADDRPSTEPVRTP
jgi:RNA polymerase sigma-70 factor (ECF subfamily)